MRKSDELTWLSGLGWTPELESPIVLGAIFTATGSGVPLTGTGGVPFPNTSVDDATFDGDAGTGVCTPNGPLPTLPLPLGVFSPVLGLGNVIEPVILFFHDGTSTDEVGDGDDCTDCTACCHRSCTFPLFGFSFSRSPNCDAAGKALVAAWRTRFPTNPRPCKRVREGLSSLDEACCVLRKAGDAEAERGSLLESCAGGVGWIARASPSVGEFPAEKGEPIGVVLDLVLARGGGVENAGASVGEVPSPLGGEGGVGLGVVVDLVLGLPSVFPLKRPVFGPGIGIGDATLSGEEILLVRLCSESDNCSLGAGAHGLCGAGFSITGVPGDGSLPGVPTPVPLRPKPGRATP